MKEEKVSIHNKYSGLPFQWQWKKIPINEDNMHRNLQKSLLLLKQYKKYCLSVIAIQMLVCV